ncbi:hypothetical protein LWI28_023074 [Acer negundo]|uniref:Uncharacterized protein n=1 Tax=Acer negundo TaxID=4023 RepID=A0AAD5JMJ1_ACENE|nr:hypothetical protein LWI28_023074 [Acer negundo]
MSNQIKLVQTVEHTFLFSQEAGVSEKIKEENLMEETAAEKEKAKDIETEVLSLSAPATANAEKKNLQNDEKVF